MARQTGVDDLDARLLSLFTADPHVGVLGASRTHVLRANTAICLVTHLEHRTGPLVDVAAARGTEGH